MKGNEEGARRRRKVKDADKIEEKWWREISKKSKGMKEGFRREEEETKSVEIKGEDERNKKMK
jgi:hypothetical protein